MKKTFVSLPRVGAAAGLLACAMSTPAAVLDLIGVPLLTQGEFRLLAEDIGALGSYKPMAPAEPLGVTGFEIGVAVSGTRLQHRDVWRKATNGADVPATVPVPAVRVIKGLPFGIDVGATYAVVPDSGGSLLGGELKWAFVEGGAVTPAVALRVSGMRSRGIDQIDFSSTSVDLSVSKGFAFVTPYAGVGSVRSKVSPNGAPTLTSETFTKGKLFGGVNLNFGVADLLAEVDKTGDATSYALRLGFRF